MSSSKTPIQEPIQETESNSTTQESQRPALLLSSPLIIEDSQESKKSKPHYDSAEIVVAGHEEEEEEEEEGIAPPPARSDAAVAEEGGSGRERLKRHRVEMAGRVWIPDMWGQEELLKDWADCASFDASLVRSTILMARDSMVKEATTPTPPHSTQILRLHHSC